MQQPPPPGGFPPPPDLPPFASSSRPIQLHAEAASPISSRPPPSHSHQPSFEELLPAGPGDEFAGDEADRGGSAGNRWPRQETLALLKIRSEMDQTFRDATLKGPLWEEVSRKLAELGYRRSAKKCKEKFENVHKYYKRTKENRTGRPDGKTYRFFSQLEALHSASPSPTQTSVPMLSPAPVPSPVQQLPPVSSSPATIGFSVTMAGSSLNRAAQISNPMDHHQSIQPQQMLHASPHGHGVSGSGNPVGISFSSNTESSESDESDDEDTEEIGGSAQEQGKRKRRSGSGSGSSKKIMQFFEGIMKQVMERQEAMQQKFLETIEKREQDRMIREEAWRRQEMARLSREQEILAQERAMAASRDAAVISFIQKMTGQNIPLPTIPAPVITVVPPPSPPAPTVTTTPLPPQPQPPHHRSHSHSHSHSQPSPKTPPPQQQQQQPPPQQQHQPPQQNPSSNQNPPHQHHLQSADIIIRPTSTEIVLAGQDHSGSGFEPGSSSTSSRWPKAEVHALIKIRSDMDSRYQEAGPKGPLWEEISSGMRRLGYNRSSKRCKEKWENINKYFKKVKESNKKRPEDSKTCPYFHQLDALYRNKYASGTGNMSGGTGSFDGNTSYPNNNSHDSIVVTTPTTPQGPPQPISQQPPAGESHNKIGNGGNDGGNNNNNNNGGTNRNGTGTERNVITGAVQVVTTNGGLTTPTFYGELKKSEDIMKDLMERRGQLENDNSNKDNNNNNVNYEKFDEGDNDSMEDDDDEFEDDEDEEEEEGDERSSSQYKIQFQRPSVNVSGSGSTNQPSSSAPGTTPGGNSFLAMVQ